MKYKIKRVNNFDGGVKNNKYNTIMFIKEYIYLVQIRCEESHVHKIPTVR